MKWSVYVVGDPKPEPRMKFARASRVAYKPGTAEGWRHYVLLAARDIASRIGNPMDTVCRLDMVFYFERPKGHFVAGDYKRIKETAPIYQGAMRDWDNLGKLVCDALQSVGVMTNDCRVCVGKVKKMYATREPPGLFLTVSDQDELGPLTAGEVYDKSLLNLEEHPRVCPSPYKVEQIGATHNGVLLVGAGNH